jgi:hypothetical protein
VGERRRPVADGDALCGEISVGKLAVGLDVVALPIDGGGEESSGGGVDIGDIGAPAVGA